MRAPIRILYVINAFAAGGTERQLLYLFGGLDRSRFAPELLTLYDTPRHYTDELNALHVPIRSLSHGIGWWGRAAPMMLYTSLMWRRRPRIVQGCLHYANLVARAARPFCPPHALITSARAAYLPGEIRWERLTHWLDDGLIVNSPHIAKQVVDHMRRPLRRIHNIPNAIPVERFEHNSQLMLRRKIFPNAQYVVGLIGRIARQKDHPTLLEALYLTRSSWPSGLKVFFLGERSEPDTQAHLDALITRYDLHEIMQQFPVTLDVASYYHMADVIVLPSLYEGFPNVILEAFAAGKPVIVSEDADAVDIVKPGVTGWRFPTRDAPTLARCLQEAWKLSADQLNQMGERARLEATNYSVETMIKRYTDLYEKLLTKRVQE